MLQHDKKAQFDVMILFVLLLLLVAGQYWSPIMIIHSMHSYRYDSSNTIFELWLWCNQRTLLLCKEKYNYHGIQTRQSDNFKILDNWFISKKKNNLLSRTFGWIIKYSPTASNPTSSERIFQMRCGRTEKFVLSNNQSDYYLQ